MGVLADIYSYSNGLKRKVNNLLADPLGTIDTGVRRMGEDQNALINLMRNAYPMAGERTVLNSPEQVAQFQSELADQGAQQAMAAATVWHGSPHKFDKFDSSKIGTGEGAQVYGHGLYLAENPTVATEYSKMASGAGGAIPSQLRFVNGQEVQPGTGAYKAASLLDNMSVAQAKKTVNGWLQGARPEEQAYFKEVADTLSGITSKSAVKQKAPGGSLYKVDLPDEHIAKMLDWDKPLSQQPQVVRDAALKHGLKWDDLSTPNLINQIGLKMGAKNHSQGASEFLQQNGVPGIRYLDGGSRGTGQGTSNFVVFPGNEGLLSILERNGQPVNKLMYP